MPPDDGAKDPTKLRVRELQHHRPAQTVAMQQAQSDIGTTEIAIRLAPGARRAGIPSLVIRQGMGLALAGILVGLFAAIGPRAS